MKSDWKFKILSDLCEFQRGLTYAKGDEVDSSSNIVLRATNINLETNLLDFSELKYINDNVIVPSTKKVQKDSLIICTASGSKSHLGKVAYIDKDYGYAFGGFMGMITPKEELLPKYLFHLMTSESYKNFISELSNGVNINNLKYDDLRKFVIPIPSFSVQQRIVAILDEAFDAIAIARANAERNRQNARALFESHLQTVFSQHGDGWVNTTLGNEIELITGFAFKSEKYTTSDKGMRLLRGDNIIQGAFRWDDVKKWPEEDCADYKRYELKDGDVILAMDRPWISAGIKCAQITEVDLPCLLVQRTACIRGANRVINRFLFYLIRSASFSRHILGIQTGLSVPHISGQQIKDYPFHRPSLKEQIRLVTQLDNLTEETQRLESIYQQKLAVLDELKQALLYQAFNGELPERVERSAVEAGI